jgi:ankyrin repeat protein
MTDGKSPGRRFSPCIEIARLLVKAGANVNSPSSDGHRYTALHIAAEFGCFELAKELLDANANANAVVCPPEKKFYRFPATTSLQYAVGNKDKRLVRLLVDAGADVKCTSLPCARKDSSSEGGRRWHT